MQVIITTLFSASTIIQYGIKSWPIWECEPSKFQWNYDDKEIFLIIEGHAKISTQHGDIYVIKAGDLVEFPAGLFCEWQVTKSVKNIIDWAARFKKKDFFSLLLSQCR